MRAVGDGSGGVVVPAQMAALVDKLLEYGLDALATRNGTLPEVAGLNGLRAQLTVAARAARGTGRRMVLAPARPSYVTVGEAAELLGVSPRYVRRLAAEGVIRGSKPGRDWQLDRDGLEGRRRRWQGAA
ncbi:excisionase family DNA-binding protein [Streptomyces mirabilis]|uniref:excisionase family DNA-binding protein n=1 Tax=Streptomyces mirabilis TaxID=68239 RepID=UPI00363B2A84